MREKKLCFNYPKNKQSVVIKAMLMFSVSIFSFVIAFNEFNNNINITILSLGFFSIVGALDGLSKIHRIISYDQVCIENNRLIIKNKKKILNKVPIEEIQVVSKTNPFNMFQTSWKRLYYNNTLIFHYETNEINEANEKKFTNIIENGVENGR